MFRTFGLCLSMVLAPLLMAFSGEKQSGVEGTILDESNSSVAGVKITAVQEEKPLKGYEAIEGVVGADGTFRLSGLYPSSKYVLMPWSDKWFCPTAAVKFESAPQGETLLLEETVIINRSKLQFWPTNSNSMMAGYGYKNSLPNRFRAMMQSNESSAIGNIRTISGSQDLYKAQKGHYAATFDELTKGTPIFLDGIWTDKRGRDGYLFTLSGGGVGVKTFSCKAIPVNPNVTGIRSFFVDESLVIRADNSGNPSVASKPIGTP